MFFYFLGNEFVKGLVYENIDKSKIICFNCIIRIKRIGMKKVILLVFCLRLFAQTGPYQPQRPECGPYTPVSYQESDGTMVYGCQGYILTHPLVANGGSELTKVKIANNSINTVLVLPATTLVNMNAEDDDGPFIFGGLLLSMPKASSYEFELLGVACPTGQPCSEAAKTVVTFDGSGTKVTAPDEATLENITVSALLRLQSGTFLVDGVDTRNKNQVAQDIVTKEACYFGGLGLEVPYGVSNMSLASQAVEITAWNSAGAMAGHTTTPILITGGKLPADETEVEPGPNPQMGLISDLFPDLQVDGRGRFCGKFQFHGQSGNIAASVGRLVEPRVHRVPLGSEALPSLCREGACQTQ